MMPITANASNENTVNVSYARAITPFLCPLKPDDSENRYENGNRTNSDIFEHKNT